MKTTKIDLQNVINQLRIPWEGTNVYEAFGLTTERTREIVDGLDVNHTFKDPDTKTETLARVLKYALTLDNDNEAMFIIDHCIQGQVKAEQKLQNMMGLLERFGDL